MAQNWPVNVPYTFDKTGFNYDRQDGVIETDMDTGPSKKRRRFTAVSKYYKGQILMTKTQFDTFETWFEVTIMMGALSFYFVNPLDTAETIEARFRGPYSTAQAGDSLDLYVKFEIEVMPA